MSHPQVDAVAADAAAAFDSIVDRLKNYVSYPAISCDPARAGDVRALAAKIRDDLAGLGLQGARVCELADALPMVVAEYTGAGADKPTVLIYGHLDLQPVKGEQWETPPHEGTIRGERLYARGASDDMGGWVSHLAAISAWLGRAGGLPCNLKLVIEGEEEIGSPNLERFMDAFPGAFSADVMVLTDCENPATDVPGLTVSLRGLAEFDVVCEALEADVHSGLWGGMVPDVSLALVKLVARVADDDGRMAIARVAVPQARRDGAEQVPLDDDVIRAGAHLLPGVQPLPLRGTPAAEWMWWQPSITVVSSTLPTLDHKKNALRRSASARLSVRLAPGQTVDDMERALRDVLLVNTPCNVKVRLVSYGGSEGWLYEPKGPAFPAANRAYVKAWGRPMVAVGVGGSIPFVTLFGRRFADLPLILNGVMDPLSTAHGPNESLHLGVFKKAILANVYLYDELGALGKAGLRSGS